jgi:hypothetical protein
MKIAIDANLGPRDFCGMGEFRAHDPKLGHRLERQVWLGPAGLSRRLAPDAPSVKAERLPSAEGAQSRKSGDFVNQGPKGGRPRTIDGRFGKLLSGSAGATTGSG